MFFLHRSNPVCRIPILLGFLALLPFTLACARGADDGKRTGASSQPAGNDSRTPAVKEFVEKYFRTWSNQEMDAYGEGFLPGAIVQFIDPQGDVDSRPLRQFLSDQKRFQLMRPAKETPLSIDIRFENRLARAVVYWKLDDGSGPAKFGYDHFTLLERDGKWRIVNLAFYETNPAP
jgi:hypothetical protein